MVKNHSWFTPSPKSIISSFDLSYSYTLINFHGFVGTHRFGFCFFFFGGTLIRIVYISFCVCLNWTKNLTQITSVSLAAVGVSCNFFCSVIFSLQNKRCYDVGFLFVHLWESSFNQCENENLFLFKMQCDAEAICLNIAPSSDRISYVTINPFKSIICLDIAFSAFSDW